MDTFFAIKREYKKFPLHTELQPSRLIFPATGEMVSYLLKVILSHSKYCISEFRRSKWWLAVCRLFKRLVNWVSRWCLLPHCGEGNSAKWVVWSWHFLQIIKHDTPFGLVYFLKVKSTVICKLFQLHQYHALCATFRVPIAKSVVGGRSF